MSGEIKTSLLTSGKEKPKSAKKQGEESIASQLRERAERLEQRGGDDVQLTTASGPDEDPDIIAADDPDSVSAVLAASLLDEELFAIDGGARRESSSFLSCCQQCTCQCSLSCIRGAWSRMGMLTRGLIAVMSIFAIILLAWMPPVRDTHTHTTCAHTSFQSNFTHS